MISVSGYVVLALRVRMCDACCVQGGRGLPGDSFMRAMIAKDLVLHGFNLLGILVAAA